MRSFQLFIALCVPWTAAFSFNAYDLGFHGIYPVQHFHSVDLEPPAPKVTRWDSRCDPGNLFLTPRGRSVTGAARGPVILDPKGNLIWMDNEKFRQALNFNVQKYKGQDYLTFWTKSKKGCHPNHPKKTYVMLNSSYEVAYRIFPKGKHMKADSHEFKITADGTALITIYQKRQTDCRGLGLGATCWIQDGIFQEIDIETGELVFEWRATDHISPSDLFSRPSRKDGHGKSKKDAFDFFHINSVDKLPSGDYLISARYMHAVVCISAKTGEVLWQLGGKNNAFQDLNGATDFAWQHHARWLGNGTISVFDNHANNVVHSPSSHSKGMLIQLDLENMTARLVRKFVHPDKILNVSQGSVQVLPQSDTVLVGFGNSPTFVEYTPAGQVLCSAHFAPHLVYEILDVGFVKSYRIFKSPWVGTPNTAPDIKVKNRRAYVSWNGATEVKSWRLQMARSKKASDDEFVTLQELSRDAFETRFSVPKVKKGYVRIAALDDTREVMAYSRVVRAHSHHSVFLRATVFFILASSVIFLLSIAVSAFFHRRLPRLPRLARLSKFTISGLKSKSRSQSRSRSHPATLGHQDYGAELGPLLSSELDPERPSLESSDSSQA